MAVDLTNDPAIKAPNKELRALRKSHAAIGNKIATLGNKIDVENHAKQTINNFADALEAFVAGRENSKGYHWIAKFFNGTDQGFYQSDGYLPDTQQYILKLLIKPEYSDEKIKEIAASMEADIIPVTRVSKENGGKYFSIFENSLSEHGRYSLLVSDNDTKFAINKSSYYRIRVESEYDNLEEALLYIRNNLYYGDSDEEDDNDHYYGYEDSNE